MSNSAKKSGSKKASQPKEIVQVVEQEIIKTTVTPKKSQQGKKQCWS